jgi:methylthioribose-1-phosphate isomerase
MPTETNFRSLLLDEPHYRAVRWVDGQPGTPAAVRLLDQKALPNRVTSVDCTQVAALCACIRNLTVRGAPAIGIAAAYGVALAAANHPGDTLGFLQIEGPRQIRLLSETRPTAVNLFWALNRMGQRLVSLAPTLPMAAVTAALLAEARAIDTEDEAMCRAIGQFGAEVLPAKGGVLTHCNAGGLATSVFGTALSVIIHAVKGGKKLDVYADETRPLLQGARLTTWELKQWGITPTLIGDAVGASLMARGLINAVVTGADRICANGDTANKIGTYAVAIAAKHHGIPFYIAAPSSTIDLALATGDEIPIEARDAAEVTNFPPPDGPAVAPAGINVLNPAFDVTPAALISGIITERGVLHAPYIESLSVFGA